MSGVKAEKGVGVHQNERTGWMGVGAATACQAAPTAAAEAADSDTILVAAAAGEGTGVVAAAAGLTAGFEVDDSAHCYNGCRPCPTPTPPTPQQMGAHPPRTGTQ